MVLSPPSLPPTHLFHPNHVMFPGGGGNELEMEWGGGRNPAARLPSLASGDDEKLIETKWLREEEVALAVTAGVWGRTAAGVNNGGERRNRKRYFLFA